jgi:hypothetical protein
LPASAEQPEPVLDGERTPAYPPEAVLQDLLAGSERVFLGRCVGLSEEISSGASTSIVTVTFEVEADLLGSDTDEITFRFYSPSTGSRTGTGPAPAPSPEEIAAYGAIETASGPSGNRSSDRIERLNSIQASPKSEILGHDDAPLRFHVGEEVLLFLPPLTGNGFLRSNDPGFAKMTVVDIGPEGVRAAIASAGPSRLTALPFLPARQGRVDELIGRIERSVAASRGMP